MNNIDTNKIKNELIHKLKIGIPRDTGSILWQLIDAVETLQQNQNKLLEKIQELEYTTSRLSSNECDCSECRGNYE
jgi:hypothetical protein